MLLFDILIIDDRYQFHIIYFYQDNINSLSPYKQPSDLGNISMKPKKILVFKLVLMILVLICIGGFLILKIMFHEFIQQYDPLQYTLCSHYIKEKYSNAKAYSLIQDVQLILALILQLVMIGKCLYIILKEKPEKIIDVAGSKWLKAEIIMSKVIMIFLICFIASLLSSIRQHQQCTNINTKNFIILLAINLFALLFKILLTAINFYLIYKNNSHLESLQPVKQSSNPQDIQQHLSQLSQSLDEGQILRQLERMEQGNIFDMDSKNIRETLLNQHKMPDEQNPMDNFGVGNKFQQSPQNQKSRLQQKLKKLKRALLKRKNPNFSNQNNEKIQEVIEEQFIPGPGDELDPTYDRQKAKQMNKSEIQRLQNKGYTIQQRPYIQRIILAKTYTIKDNQQSKSPPMDRNAKNQSHNCKSNLTVISEQVRQQTVDIVINLDTRQQKTPHQCYTGDDLQSIELDQIFYRQYVQKQKREKQELRLKILKHQRQMQLEKELQNSQRMKCSYHQYIQEDRNMDKIYEQARLYGSKKKQDEKSSDKEQLIFYLKTKTQSEIWGKALHEEINQCLKVEGESDPIKNYLQMRGKQKTIQKYSGPGKFKDRRNYIELIRGKGPYF